MHFFRTSNLLSFLNLANFASDYIYGGRSVGIVRLRTKGHGDCFIYIYTAFQISVL
jgi:hypothetical protein